MAEKKYVPDYNEDLYGKNPPLAETFSGSEAIARPEPAAPPNYAEEIYSGKPLRLAPSGRMLPPPGKFTPFGELRAPDPKSYTQDVKEWLHDRLIGMGADPYKAGRIAGGGVNAANTVSPMGSILSLADFQHHYGRGDYGEAAMDIIGAVPILGGVSKMVRGAPQVSRIRPAEAPPPWARVESPGEVKAINQGAQSWVVPSTREIAGGGGLKGVAPREYDAVWNAPVAFHTGEGPNIAAHIETSLGKFNRASAQTVFSTINDNVKAWHAHAGMISPADLETLHRQLKQVPKDEQAAGRAAADALERYIQSPPPGAIGIGTPEDVAAMQQNMANARGNYRSGKTAQVVETDINQVANRLGTGTDTDLATPVYQSLHRWSAVNPKSGKPNLPFSTEAERAMLAEASQPSWWDRTLRASGQGLGGGKAAAVTGGLGLTGGGGLAAMSGMGPWEAGMLGAATGAGAAGITRAAAIPFTNAANRRALNTAQESVDTILSGSPEVRARIAANPEVADPRAMMRDAMAYALMPQAGNIPIDIGNTGTAVSGRDWWNQKFVPYENRETEGDKLPYYQR